MAAVRPPIPPPIMTIFPSMTRSLETQRYGTVTETAGADVVEVAPADTTFVRSKDFYAERNVVTRLEPALTRPGAQRSARCRAGRAGRASSRRRRRHGWT